MDRKIKINDKGEVEIQHLGLGGIIGGIANAVTGLGSGFTPQNTYHAQLAPQQTSNYGPTINQASANALAGYGANQNLANQQQQLAAALGQQAQGQGPNPAQAQLAVNTGANVANQAALMAGQRGAAANPGLIARQAAQQGAATQQQAVGQAAALEAQQRLAAQQQQANLYGQIGQQNIGEQGVQGNLFGTAAGAQNAQNQAAINNYAMMQGINAGVAQQNTANNAAATSGLLNAAGAALPGIVNGLGSGLSSIASGIGGLFSAAPAAITTAGEAAGPAAGTLLAAKGGEIMPPHLQQMATLYHSDNLMNRGGKVPVMVSPGERTLSRDDVKKVVKDGKSPMEVGEQVPGKAKVKGDSEKNDTVHKQLDEGGFVIPRSIMEGKNPAEEAKKFIADHLSKKYDDGDFHQALKKAIEGRRH